MKKPRKRYILLALIAALFLVLRIASLAHATHYGSMPHQHDGIMCTSSLVDENDTDIVLPPTPILVIPEVEFSQNQLNFTSSQIFKILSQPCTRAPPVFFTH